MIVKFIFVSLISIILSGLVYNVNACPPFSPCYCPEGRLASNYTTPDGCTFCVCKIDLCVFPEYQCPEPFSCKMVNDEPMCILGCRRIPTIFCKRCTYGRASPSSVCLYGTCACLPGPLDPPDYKCPIIEPCRRCPAGKRFLLDKHGCYSCECEKND